jgi:hypothetical protein
MTSVRTKWLLASAAIAPISQVSLFGLMFNTNRMLQDGQPGPKESAERMLPYAPILMKFYRWGCFLSAAALTSRIFDNRRNSAQQ